MVQITDLSDSVEQDKDYLKSMHLVIIKNHKCQKIQWVSVSITNPCSRKAIIWVVFSFLLYYPLNIMFFIRKFTISFS